MISTLFGYLFQRENPASQDDHALAAGTALPIFLGIIPQGYITQDVINEVNALDAWSGKKTSLVVVSIDIEDPNPLSNIPNQLNPIWNNGATPFINLKAGTFSSQPTAYQIAAGYYDAALNLWAQVYNLWAQNGKWAFISVLPEMNVPWVSYGMDAANYILAYTHIRQIFAQNNINEPAVRWVFGPNAWYGNLFEAYYPGDAWVDVVGFTSYNFGSCPNNPSTWKEPEEVYGNYIAQMRNLAPTKPVFITATGTSAYTAGGLNAEAKNQWLRDAYAFLARKLGVQSILYNNTNVSWDCDWAVYQTGVLAYTGYRDAISSADFTYITPQELSLADLTPTSFSTYLPLNLANFHFWSDDLPLMVGVYPGDWLGDQSIIDLKLHALDAWSGKRSSLVGLFLNIDEQYPDTHVTGQLSMLWDNGYIPFVNITTESFTAAQIANGQADAGLRAWAQAYKVYAEAKDRISFIAPLEEMDGNWTTYGGDPTNYKLAYYRIQNIFAQEGVPERSIYWVFAPTGYDIQGYPPFENYYPGDPYVDAVGFSSYNFGYCPLNPYPSWWDAGDLLGMPLSRMQILAPSKPVIVAQVATSSYTNYGTLNPSAKNQWVMDAYSYLVDQPSVRGVIYFNYDKAGECDWGIYKTWDDNQRLVDGYRQALTNPLIQYVAPLELRTSNYFLP